MALGFRLRSGQHLLRAAEWQVAICALRAAVVAGHDDERIISNILIVERLDDTADLQIKAFDHPDQRLTFLFAGGLPPISVPRLMRVRVG